MATQLMSIDKIAVEIQEKYAAGERNFQQLSLSQATLKGLNLSYADFKGADLSLVDLREADLNHADLRGAKLDGALLQGANLTRANLSGAHLVKTNLNGANLRKAKLQGTYLKGSFLTKACLEGAHLEEAILEEAHLNGTDLTKAHLNKVSLQGAFLTDASLAKANLEGANLIGTHLNGVNLSGTHLTNAFYGDDTHFDTGVDPITVGMKKLKIPTVKELVQAFNHLSQLSHHYLGTVMTVRNWQSSRPDFEWLKQFEIDRAGKISFTGEGKEPITLVELDRTKQWVNAFIKSSSMVIQNFSGLIDREQIPFEI